MAEAIENASKERVFALKQGLVPRGTSLFASRKRWADAAAQGIRAGGKGVGIQRISGIDLQRAGNDVSKARARVTKSRKTYVRPAAGGAKPTGPAITRLKNKKSNQVTRATGTTAAQRRTERAARIKRIQPRS